MIFNLKQEMITLILFNIYSSPHKLCAVIHFKYFLNIREISFFIFVGYYFDGCLSVYDNIWIDRYRQT